MRRERQIIKNSIGDARKKLGVVLIILRLVVAAVGGFAADALAKSYEPINTDSGIKHNGDNRI